VNTYKKQLWAGLIIGGALLLALPACTGTPATPTAAPEPTATATPAASPTPTATPDPAGFIEKADEKVWQSDLDGAAELYQQALDMQPDYAPAYIGLSQVKLWRSTLSYQEALEYAQKAVESDPENAMAHATLAYIYALQDDADKALESAEEAATLEAENAYVQAVLTRAYLADRRYDQAQEAIEKAYALDPESVYVLLALGKVYRETADFPRALAAYEQIAALKPEFFNAYQSLGWFKLEQERYDEAEAAFNRSIELLPDNLDAMIGLSRLYSERHDYKTAASWLDKAEALELEKAAVYLQRSALYRLQEDYDDALEQLDQAAELEPDNYTIQTAIGFVYLSKMECSRAEREFQGLIEQRPRVAIGQIGLGFAKLCDSDVSKALSYFRKAVELEPYSSWGHQGLGSAYSLQERWEESGEAYVEAIRLSPAPASIHNFLGQWYLGQEMLEEAEVEYQLAADLNPYSQDALVGLAQTLLSENQEARALTVIQDAVALDEHDMEAQRMLGTLMVIQGDYEAGAGVVERVLEEDPEDAYAHYILGIAYCQMGEYQDAKKELKTFQTLSGVEENWIFENLLAVLDKGFTLSEDKAVAEMLKIFEELTEVKADIVVGETGEGPRMITITVPLSAEDVNAEDLTPLYSKIGMVAAVAGLRVPQIDPPLAGGALMVYERSGKPQFTVRVTLDNLQRFFYGWFGGDSFVSTLEFTQILASGPQTPLRNVERQIAEIRELDFTTAVPSEVMSKDELREHFAEGIDQEDREAIKNDAAMLALLGLIDSSQDLEKVLLEVQTEQTAGFYTPDDDKFYVLETEEQSSADQTVIAHEYVHALQDQHFDLAALTDDASDDDRRLAFRALLEGDATLSTVLYANEYVPAIDLLSLVESAGGIESEAMDSSPMVIQETLLFPYDAGLGFVKALYDRDGWESVNAAYAAPPQSTEQILHPERYWDEDAPKPVTLGNLADDLGGTWKELDSDVMGELGLRLTLATHVGPVAAAQASEGWGGDRYTLLQTGEEHVLILKTLWDDEDEAVEFFKLYRTTMAHQKDYRQDVPVLVGEMSEYWWLADAECVYTTQDGKNVTILVGDTREAVEQVLEAMQ